MVDVVLAGVVLGGVEGGRAQTWQLKHNFVKKKKLGCIRVKTLKSS